ncbi:hypothetical protein C8F04DRAFT_1340823 [Mycena alexandri]|uniref:Uncharacterized protein n=1 Tax=Mycena alexandri TaxID=1745969 RepID=A0AAD6SZT3_9AGAR|nr:hypothetical protein C8F04DRAFT_1340823 [Mycena alexandri]
MTSIEAELRSGDLSQSDCHSSASISFISDASGHRPWPAQQLLGAQRTPPLTRKGQRPNNARGDIAQATSWHLDSGAVNERGQHPPGPTHKTSTSSSSCCDARHEHLRLVIVQLPTRHSQSTNGYVGDGSEHKHRHGSRSRGQPDLVVVRLLPQLFPSRSTLVSRSAREGQAPCSIVLVRVVFTSPKRRDEESVSAYCSCCLRVLLLPSSLHVCTFSAQLARLHEHEEHAILPAPRPRLRPVYVRLCDSIALCKSSCSTAARTAGDDEHKQKAEGRAPPPVVKHVRLFWRSTSRKRSLNAPTAPEREGMEITAPAPAAPQLLPSRARAQARSPHLTSTAQRPPPTAQRPAPTAQRPPPNLFNERRRHLHRPIRPSVTSASSRTTSTLHNATVGCFSGTRGRRASRQTSHPPPNGLDGAGISTSRSTASTSSSRSAAHAHGYDNAHASRLSTRTSTSTVTVTASASAARKEHVAAGAAGCMSSPEYTLDVLAVSVFAPARWQTHAFAPTRCPRTHPPQAQCAGAARLSTSGPIFTASRLPPRACTGRLLQKKRTSTAPLRSAPRTPPRAQRLAQQR